MGQVFGATLSMKDNVSGVLKQAQESGKRFRGEVEKAKKELQKLDQKKIAEKELRIKNSAAYKAIEGVKKKLEPLSKKAVEIKARTEHAANKLKKVRSTLSTLKDKTVHIAVKGAAIAGNMIGKAALLSTAAAFTAVAAAGTVAITSAVAFESQMQNVGTLLDGDVKGKLQGMGADLKRVSLDTGVATSDLTGGLYEVVSAFGESAESVKQMEIAAKAAKAGNATTIDSVKMLSAVTKGYGDTSAAAMQKAADLAFATVKLGQTSFSELAASMGQVTPLAATLKVSEEELFGAMATLTGVTGGTSEVTTQLKATMQAFLSPSAEMAKVLKQMGYASGAAALESEGLGGILTKLKGEVKEDSVAFANLFSSVEAKNAVLSLTGVQAENFAEKTAAMGKAAGIAEQAFQTQTSSVEAMAGKIKNAGAVMLTSIGEKTLPYITKALDKVIEHLPQLEATFQAVADKVGPIIETVTQTLGDLWVEWQPVLAEIGNTFFSTFEAIQPCIEGMMQNFAAIVPYAQPMVTTFAGIIASLLPAVVPIFEGISSVVATVFPIVSEIIQGVGSKISSVFQIIGSHSGTLASIFEAVGPAISTVLETAWSIISPILDVAISVFGILADVIGWAFPYIQGIISNTWSDIEPIVTGIGEGLGVVADIVGQIGEGVFSVFGGSNGKSVDANATGSSYYGGGWTTVGEHGPELLNLPSGSEILSNSQSRQAMGRGDISINIAKMEVRNDQDIEAVAEAIVRKIEEAEENM